MTSTLAVSLAVALTVAPAVDLPTKFWGITPNVVEVDLPKLKKTNDTAVVLIHGLMVHPFRPDLAEWADPHSWQKPTGEIVKSLAADADVFGFSYAQTVSVDSVAISKGFRDGISALKAAGYKQVVLVGHSAGGIISRRFVELYPDAGVTKVLCIGCPHLGSDWAHLPDTILPRTQQRFIQSMQRDVRESLAKEWTTEMSPDVQFCSVLCKLPRLGNDTVVSLTSQWPDQLQKQGVPAVLVACNHFDAMKSEKTAKAISELMKGKIVRWTPEQVETARTALFGAKEKK